MLPLSRARGCFLVSTPLLRLSSPRPAHRRRRHHRFAATTPADAPMNGLKLPRAAPSAQNHPSTHPSSATSHDVSRRYGQRWCGVVGECHHPMPAIVLSLPPDNSASDRADTSLTREAGSLSSTRARRTSVSVRFPRGTTGRAAASKV